MKCVSFAWMGGRGVHCEYWLSWGWWPSLLTLSSPASPQPPSVCVPLSIWCISLPFCWCTSTSLCWFGDHFFRLSFCCIYFTLPHASLHRPPKNLFSHPNIWFCSQPWSKLVNGPNTNKVEEQKIWEYWKRNRNSLYTIKQFMSEGFKLVCDSWHHSTLKKATSLCPTHPSNSPSCHMYLSSEQQVPSTMLSNIAGHLDVWQCLCFGRLGQT